MDGGRIDRAIPSLPPLRMRAGIPSSAPLFIISVQMSKKGSHENRNVQSNAFLYALKDGRNSGRTLEAQLTVTMVENCRPSPGARQCIPQVDCSRTLQRLTGVGCIVGSGDISSERWTHPFPVAFRVLELVPKIL